MPNRAFLRIPIPLTQGSFDDTQVWLVETKKLYRTSPKAS